MTTASSTLRPLRVVTLMLACTASMLARPALAITALEVNQAAFTENTARKDGPDPATLRAQILLDRLRFSPGSIDGREGDNFTKALDAYSQSLGRKPEGHLTKEVWDALVASYAGPVLVPYTIAEADTEGPFLEHVPRDFEAMAELKHLGYGSAKEELAERFHLSPGLLEALNPGLHFDRAGEVIMVGAARPDPEPTAISNRNKAATDGGKAPVVRIAIDKTGRALRAFDAQGQLVAFYPASIGSDEKPAPSGQFEIRAIARDPTYTYDPEYAFKGVKTKRKLTIPAGPNNPVGSVWLDLTADSYGIHGTPEPERVGKTFSHGCIRLTNWDVKDLASLAGKGTAVDFGD